MKLITIQHEEVFELLQKDVRYHAEYSRVPSNLVVAYQMMQSYYGWDSCPIFCGPVNKPTFFCGCKTDDAVVLQLDVPDEVVKIQYFYDWSDVAYFSEFPNEFAETFNLEIYSTLESYAKDVFEGKDLGSYNVFQATIPYIRPEWLECSSKDCTKFLDNFNNGAWQTLAELQTYITKEHISFRR